MTHKSHEVESKIRLFTDDWELRSARMNEIDVPRSRHAQNRRTEKLDDEHAFRIAESADAGVEFPPIVANQVGDSLWIIDGNHRHAASELLGRDTIPAYVVKVDHDTYTQMCLWFNATNGKPLSDADRVQNALAQIHLGMPATTASKLWGIRPERLQVLRREREGREKVAMAGIKAPKLSAAAAEIANRLEVDHIKRLGAELPQATAKDLEDAVRAINAAPAAERDTEALRQSVVLEQRRQTRAAPKAKQKGAMTSAQARTRLKEVLIAVRANRALLNDQALVRLISELAEVSDGAARSAA